MKVKILTLALAPFSLTFSQEIVLEKVEVKAKREVLTEQEVRESSAKDPGEALSRMEGVWKIRKGGIANDVVIRGFYGGNVNILYDDARIYGACPNRMDPPIFHIDFAEVKDIEVVKGPFDVRNYGGLGGTVNVRTLRPERGFHGKLNLGAGSFSYFNPSLNLSYGGERYYGMLGYSYRYSKPYKTGEGKRFTEYANYKPSERSSTAFSINTLWTKLGFNPSRETSLEVSYTAQRARDVLYPYLMMDSPEDNTDRVNLKVKIGALSLNTYFSYVYHLMNNSKRSAPSFMETIAKTTTYGAKAEYELGSLTFGLEAFKWNWKAKERMSMAQNIIPDVDLIDTGLFGEYRRELSDRMRLIAGLRVDVTKTQADGGEANTDLYYRYHGTRKTSATDTYPSGNLQIFYALTRELELFTGLGYSVRVPDAQERFFALDRMGPMEASYGDWVGNPDLKPPKNTELDVGLNVKGRSLSAKVNLFYSFVKDYITLYRDTDVFPSTTMGSSTQARSYTNVDAHLYGGEAQITYSLTDRLFLEGGLSYVRGRKDTDPSKNIRDRDIAEIPPLKTRVALRYDTGYHFGEVEVLAQATQDKVDSDLRERKTSGWAVINLKAGAHVGNFRLTAGVENLLDKFYYEHLSYSRDPFATGTKVPEPGRNFYLSVGYVF